MSDQVREIKDKIDIVSIIGSRVELSRAGKQLKGLCPFHAERSPSFFVSPEMGMYKCFGCGASGDVYTFLQEYEGMNFREALETLAEIAGVKLETHHQDDQENQNDTYKIILNLAQDFYHYLLSKHSVGKVALNYLKKRQIPASIIDQFGLGCAPNSWNTLYRYLVEKKKFKAADVEAAGLIIKGNHGYYDRFRHRLMFPLTDFRGRVVGFSGRTLDHEAKEAKYINTPETKIYHKRELLFGLYQARSAIRKKDAAIIVEGEFDVLSSLVAGVYNIAAVKGSALTKEHLQLLNRLTNNITLCLDADKAGDAATKKGIELADAYGMNVSVVVLNQGKDPDEFAQTNPKGWKELVKKPQSIYQFYIDSIFAAHDPKTGLGKKEIVKGLVPVLAGISNSVEQAHYLDLVARRLAVNQNAIQTELEKFLRFKQLPKTAKVETETEEVAPATQLERLERQLWGSWLSLAPKDKEASFPLLGQLKWQNPGLLNLTKSLAAWLEHHQFELKSFSLSLPTQLQQLLGQLYLDSSTIQFEPSLDRVESLVEQVRVLHIKRQIKSLSERIAQLEAQTQLSDSDQTNLGKMQVKVSNLIKQLHSSRDVV